MLKAYSVMQIKRLRMYSTLMYGCHFSASRRSRQPPAADLCAFKDMLRGYEHRKKKEKDGLNVRGPRPEKRW
jgi:predicted nucleotidyltransferase